jgi:regulator of replication initiation timing|tara:strand:+ start:205 stop:357 length:153 start_codon:yes stop_codon:yes gene_type:complete
MTPQLEMNIGELDKSIIALSKRKLKLLQEVQQINMEIAFLRKQQEQLTNV